MAEYAEGGWIPGGPTLGRVGLDECLFRTTAPAAFRVRCCRPGHPTPTSGCGKPGATIEPPEATH